MSVFKKANDIMPVFSTMTEFMKAVKISYSSSVSQFPVLLQMLLSSMFFGSKYIVKYSPASLQLPNFVILGKTLC